MAVFKPKTSPVGPQGACETSRNAEKCIYTYVYTSRVESVVFEVLADSTRRRIVETLGAAEPPPPPPLEALDNQPAGSARHLRLPHRRRLRPLRAEGPACP